MTVAKDEQKDPSLSRRVEIANSAGDVDLFVSIHSNAFGNGDEWTSPKGWEVYSYKKGTDSEKAAKAISRATSKMIPEFVNRGTKTANFYVIKNTTMPAVLIEHGFYTNKEEVELLKDDSFRSRLAQADAQGIMDFLNSYK